MPSDLPARQLEPAKLLAHPILHQVAPGHDVSSLKADLALRMASRYKGRVDGGDAGNAAPSCILLYKTQLYAVRKMVVGGIACIIHDQGPAAGDACLCTLDLNSRPARYDGVADGERDRAPLGVIPAYPNQADHQRAGHFISGLRGGVKSGVRPYATRSCQGQRQTMKRGGATTKNRPHFILPRRTRRE
jgi:hypothetical protein